MGPQGLNLGGHVQGKYSTHCAIAPPLNLTNNFLVGIEQDWQCLGLIPDSGLRDHSCWGVIPDALHARQMSPFSISPAQYFKMPLDPAWVLYNSSITFLLIFFF